MVDALVHEMLTTLQAATGAAALTAGGQAAGAPVAAGAAAVVGGGVPVGGQAAGAPVTAGVAALAAGRHADGAPVAAGAAALAAGGAAGDEKRLRDKERRRLASQAARDRNGPAINLRRRRPRAKVVKPVPARMPEERLQKRAADARRRRRVAAAAAGAAKKQAQPPAGVAVAGESPPPPAGVAVAGETTAQPPASVAVAVESPPPPAGVVNHSCMSPRLLARERLRAVELPGGPPSAGANVSSRPPIGQSAGPPWGALLLLSALPGVLVYAAPRRGWARPCFRPTGAIAVGVE